MEPVTRDALRTLRLALSQTNVDPVIAFEGPDGAGKSLYSMMFVQWISNLLDAGQRVAMLRSPSRMPNTIGSAVGRTIIDSRAPGGHRLDPAVDALAMMLVRQCLPAEFRTYQENGAVWLVADRWKHSFLAHQLCGTGLAEADPKLASWMGQHTIAINPLLTVMLVADDVTLDYRLSRAVSHAGNYLPRGYVAKMRKHYTDFRGHVPSVTHELDRSISYSLQERTLFITQHNGENSVVVFDRILMGFRHMIGLLLGAIPVSVGAVTPRLEPEVPPKPQEQ